MMRTVKRLASNRSGSAAAEMALTMPLLLLLLFGAFELGYFFMSEHVVLKAVRDSARYAARLPVTDGTTTFYNCSGTPTVESGTEQKIQRVARFGDPDATSGARLFGWTADNMTTVTLACDTDVTHSYVNKGVYTEFPDGVPVVTVSASVPYPTLFGIIGFGTTSLTLNAQSQAAVFGA